MNYCVDGNRADQSAADELYQRYEQRVLRLAEKKLGNYLWRRVSPDDIMMMAMKSLLRVTVEENCTLDRNQSLWGLVVSITDRKILKEAAFHAGGQTQRPQRDGSRCGGVANAVGPNSARHNAGRYGSIGGFIGDHPLPIETR